MTNINLRLFVSILVALVAAGFLGIAWLRGLDLANPSTWVALTLQVATLLFVIVLLFVKWGWTFKLLYPWLVPYPNLNGTWTGQIISDWKTPDGKVIAPIPAMLTIKQSFLRVSCVMRTAEMRSDAHVAGFQIDSDKQQKQLAYIYMSKPALRISERSVPHDGAVVFEIIDSTPRQLKGIYWTGRKTTGEIEFKFHSKDLLDELPTNLNKHPMTDM